MLEDMGKIKREVLRYLGYRGQTIDDGLNQLIDKSIRLAKDLEDRRYVYGLFDLKRNKGLRIGGSNFYLEGKSIAEHLDGSDQVILFAASIGLDIERKINYYEKFDMTKSLVLDACGSAFIERLCNDICDRLEISYGKLTNRFSPGYGDFPIDIQKDFIKLLDADIRAGITVSDYNILMPRKSVTAVLGLTDQEFNGHDKCVNCDSYNDCPYRRDW